MVVACTLTPDELRSRRGSLLPGLAARATSRTATDDGYRLQFAASSDMARAIGETIDAERRCCRFLRFSVTAAANNGPIELTMSGPAGTREFLEALLEA